MRTLIIVVFFLARVPYFHSQNNIVCTNGDPSLSFLIGQKDLNIVFDYSTLTYDSISDFQEYVHSRPNQNEVTQVATYGIVPIVTTTDGNAAYDKVAFRPEKRKSGEKTFINELNKITVKRDIYCSDQTKKGKYTLLVKFNEIVTEYKSRFGNSAVVKLKLKRFFIYFIVAETGDVVAELINTEYPEKWQSFSHLKIAEDFGAYIRKKLKL